MKSKKILLKDVILTQEEKEQIASELEQEKALKKKQQFLKTKAFEISKDMCLLSFEEKKKVLSHVVDFINEEAEDKINESKRDISYISSFIDLVSSEKIINPFK